MIVTLTCLSDPNLPGTEAGALITAAAVASLDGGGSTFGNISPTSVFGNTVVGLVAPIPSGSGSGSNPILVLAGNVVTPGFPSISGVDTASVPWSRLLSTATRFYDSTNNVTWFYWNTGPFNALFPTSGSVPVTFTGSSIAISPTNPSCNYGNSIYFTETGDDGHGVVWSVNGVPGGNSVVGTISPYGVYTAPTLAQVIANGPLASVTIGVSNADGGGSPSSASTTVTFNLPLFKAYGKFRGQKVFRPVSLVNVGSINPKIYAPSENITVKSQS